MRPLVVYVATNHKYEYHLKMLVVATGKQLSWSIVVGSGESRTKNHMVPYVNKIEIGWSFSKNR